jgi:hypothetical protein
LDSARELIGWLSPIVIFHRKSRKRFLICCALALKVLNAITSANKLIVRKNLTCGIDFSQCKDCGTLEAFQAPQADPEDHRATKKRITGLFRRMVKAILFLDERQVTKRRL